MAATQEEPYVLDIVGRFNFQGQDFDAETIKTSNLY
jgi:hypothetical protein